MRLSNQDAAFLYAETASAPMHDATFSVIEGRLSTAAVQQHIAGRIHLIPRLRQRLAFVPLNLAHPQWVDDPDFSLENQVTAHHVQRGTSLQSAIAEGVEHLQWLLPRDRPLWRIIVIEGVRNRTILVQATHRAMADGASPTDLSPVLFDLKANAVPPPVPEIPWSPEPLPALAELVRAGVADNLQRLSNALPSYGVEPAVRLSETLRRASESLTRFVAQPLISAPWNAGLVGPKRRLEWRQVPLSEIREVRRSLGGSINDVVLAVVSEAAARYLADKAEAVKGKHLRVMCPVSVRADDEQNSTANRASATFPITSAQPMQITARLEQIRLETEQLKHVKEAYALDTLREMLPGVPAVMMAPSQLVGTAFDPTALAATFPGKITQPFGLRAPAPVNFACMNVPGMQTPAYFAGHQLLDTFSMPILGANLGFGVAVSSYNQKLYFNFVAEPRLMPDPEKMADLAVACFVELLASAREAARKAG